MNVIEKHTKFDFVKALKEEISILKNLSTFSKKRLSAETLNPESPVNCFLGQGFNQTTKTGSVRANSHRKKIGEVYLDNVEFGTPLEVWSFIEWREGNKKDVIKVLNHLKSGSRLPSIKVPKNTSISVDLNL